MRRFLVVFFSLAVVPLAQYTPPNAQHSLGAHVGKALGININDVQIFPPHEPSLSSVDIWPDQMKTLHAFVPGTEIRKMSKALKYFTLKGGLSTKINFCGEC